MIKKNLKILITTSVVILLPVLVGLVLWGQLPERIPIHWNAAGEIDGWSSKPFAIFGLPLILLGFQWFCVLATLADPKRGSHTEKMLQLVFWIIPVLSVVAHMVVYMTALGIEVRMERIMPALMGLLFVIIGNYLPKCKQNYTIGIKIPWTLNSEENWQKTHRFAGKVWVVCGCIMMLTSFFGGVAIFFAVALLMVLTPCIYSYILYRKGI